MCNEFDSVWAADTVPAPVVVDRYLMTRKRETEDWAEYRERLNRQMTPGLACNILTDEQFRWREMMKG